MHTAREAFLNSPERPEFEKMATTLTFENACRAALLVYLEECNRIEKDPNDACGAHHRIVGATQVLYLLRQLHLKPEQPKAYKSPQLTPPK